VARSRLQMLVRLAMAGAVLGCGPPPVAPGDVGEQLRALSAPNIVLVVVDTLRADWLGPWGDARGASPELDRWAGRGVVFEEARAQSSWTKTSMASLLTSTWPHTSGVTRSTDGLGDAALTLAEVLRDGGYRTYAVQSNGWLEQTFGFHQGFDRYRFPRGGTGVGQKPSLWPHGDNVYREAARLLEAHARGSPFFLYVHLMDVHEYAAPPEFKRYGAGNEGAYRAAIRWVDDVLERLRSKLDDEGLLEDTVIVLAADHGESFGEDGSYGHARDVRTPVLHVPILLRPPFDAAPVRVSTQVRNIDLAPTLVELAGLEVPEDFEGESLLPLLRAGADRISFASLGDRLYPDAVLQDSVSDGDWTFARNRGEAGDELLFDRSVDPWERVNLIEVEPDDAARMRALLDTHLARRRAAGSLSEEVHIDPGLAEKLRALGYAR